MTLVDDIIRARSDFDSADLDEFLNIVTRVRDELRTNHTRKYLEEKIESARCAEPEKRRLACKKLLPYLDWYLADKRP